MKITNILTIGFIPIAIITAIICYTYYTDKQSKQEILEKARTDINTTIQLR
jgi:hypothetical protein